jgi:hypothetical protein
MQCHHVCNEKCTGGNHLRTVNNNNTELFTSLPNKNFLLYLHFWHWRVIQYVTSSFSLYDILTWLMFTDQFL